MNMKSKIQVIQFNLAKYLKIVFKNLISCYFYLTIFSKTLEKFESGSEISMIIVIFNAIEIPTCDKHLLVLR